MALILRLLRKTVLFHPLNGVHLFYMAGFRAERYKMKRETTGRHREIPDQAFTHGGKFHADDVFSTALLRLLRPGLRVRRGFRVPEGFDGLVYDIGGGRFDHHQSGAPVRENGAPYAAFGLLWRVYGPMVLAQGLPPEAIEEEAVRFDEKFIQPLDRDDNTGCGHPLGEVIGSFNPVWDSETSVDRCFEEAVAFAGVILKKRLEDVYAARRAKALVEAALARMEEGVVVLERFAPWKGVLVPSDAQFVVYPSQRGGWSAQGVPLEDGDGALKCLFPAAWAGRAEQDLSALSGIPDLTFCHNNRFLVSTKTREGAVAACRAALREQGRERGL